MKKWFMALMICLLFIGANNVVYAEQTMVQSTDKNGQTTTYGELVSTMKLNGEEQDLNNMPGVIVDGKVMLPRYLAFKKIMGMKIAHTSNTITLKTKEHTAEFTMDSTKALVDGEEVDLAIAPFSAKFVATNENTMMLPAEDIAKIFGYEYSYDAVNQVVSFEREGGMELSYGGLSYYYKDEPIDLYVDGKEVDTAISGFFIDECDFVPAWRISKELGVKYSKSGKKITMTRGNYKVVFNLYKTNATVNGKAYTLDVAPTYIKDKENNVGAYMVPGKVVAEALGFGYEWNEEDYSSSFKKSEEYQIAIPLPEDCQDENYETNDDYFNNRFEIILDGNYSSFYKKNVVSNPYFAVDKVSVSTSSGKTKIILQASEIKGYRLKEENGILYVKVGTPKEIYDKILVLDAGHGGTDPGAAGNGIYESNCTLNIIKAAKDYFDEDDSIKVYYTRTTNTQANMTSGSDGLNTSTSLRARTDLANEVDADLFISVHINSAGNTTARGTEVYYSSNNNKKNSGGLSASKLAQMAYDNVVKAVGSSKRGVKTANFYVIRYTNMPAILIETAFISNKQDAEILKSDKKIDQIGKSIYDTVVSAFGKYPTGR